MKSRKEPLDLSLYLENCARDSYFDKNDVAVFMQSSLLIKSLLRERDDARRMACRLMAEMERHMNPNGEPISLKKCAKYHGWEYLYH